MKNFLVMTNPISDLAPFLSHKIYLEKHRSFRIYPNKTFSSRFHYYWEKFLSH